MNILSSDELDKISGGDYDLGYEVGFAISEGIGYLNGKGRQLGGWIYEALHNH